MHPKLSDAIPRLVQQALGPSARWSVRRAAAILTVLLAHLSLMVTPLHADHMERFGHGDEGVQAGAAQAAARPFVERSDHGAVSIPPIVTTDAHSGDHASHMAATTAAAPVRPSAGSLESASLLVTHTASAEDCGIQWSRTRQQPADSTPLASAAASSAGGLLLSSFTPARSALAAPLRRGDTQALLQVYRL